MIEVGAGTTEKLGTGGEAAGTVTNAAGTVLGHRGYWEHPNCSQDRPPI